LAKIVNFGIAYAVEAFGLSQRVGISKAEARKVIDDYFATYKGIREYMDRIPHEAREKGYVTSLFGRRRYFSGINDRNFAVRSRAEREAINMPNPGNGQRHCKDRNDQSRRGIKGCKARNKDDNAGPRRIVI
jgi:DNA polymerase-1